MYKNYEVESFEGEEFILERLAEFGFSRGQSFQLVGRSLFGQPYIAKIGNLKVALRAVELESIKVKV
ncbi:MAG: hypothetical protein HOO06_04575 [Bdellovibrionaceae bacterium]|nr:hypothetical protein [Pseudobdellovibrionaceae bacterium]